MGGVMVNVASVIKAIVLQLKPLFLSVGIATTESNQDDQSRPDNPVYVCVFASYITGYAEMYIYVP